MLDKNIDKDIEIVKNIKYITLTGDIDGKFVRAELPKHYLQAIENVLSELETWKKIAEFLAKNSVMRAKCERCVEDLDENGCIRCMLNWAKSEVLKNE